MANDFPDSVFAQEGPAEAYVKERMDLQRLPSNPNPTPRVYFRTYPFVVQETK